jgi:hypothetical protein
MPDLPRDHDELARLERRLRELHDESERLGERIKELGALELEVAERRQRLLRKDEPFLRPDSENPGTPKIQGAS